MKSKNILTNQQKKRVYKLYCGGRSQASLARRFNVSPSTIKIIIDKKRGYTLKLTGKKRGRKRNLMPDQEKKIYELYKSGIIQKNLAIRYNISPMTISKIIQRQKYEEKKNENSSVN